jgi:hypothetical protein
VSSYPVPACAVPVSAGMIVAVPLELLASPLKGGRDLGGETGPRWSSAARRASGRTLTWCSAR